MVTGAYVEDIQLVLDFSDFVTAGARCHIQYWQQMGCSLYCQRNYTCLSHSFPSTPMVVSHSMLLYRWEIIS